MNHANQTRRTPFYDRHLASGARMVDFAGWEMPLNFPGGVVAEHLATRRNAGLFDVSHMGRFSIGGSGARAFLQTVLTNDAGALAVGRSHYTLLATETGGAADDAFLYRFSEDGYLLVVNAANREKDWDLLKDQVETYSADRADRMTLRDLGQDMAMISLQGPESERILSAHLKKGALPEPRRNSLSMADIAGEEVYIGRTGYTGEPVCFEMFALPEHAGRLWDLLVESGATPVGLGARDTLRLEASMPLYGHEQGSDPDGLEIPLLSCPVASFGVSLSPERGDFVGRAALARQQKALDRIAQGDYAHTTALPRLIQAVAVTGRGVARADSPVKKGEEPVGWVTSGTAVPYWKWMSLDAWFDAHDAAYGDSDEEHRLRSICLAYLDSDVGVGDRLTIDVRGRNVEAVVVPKHLKNDTPPYARPLLYGSTA